VRRAAYERETKWAPSYVVDELREAHLAEDTYRADAVRAWYRTDAAVDETERARARREAEESSALAQEVGAHREALAEVAEARRGWHAATELDRQRALTADTELRRRHPDAELPPLHSAGEPNHPEPDAGNVRDERSVDQSEADASAAPSRRGVGSRDIKAALVAARSAQRIIAERERQADRETRLASDDVVRRREAEAMQEASARRSAVRQDPVPSRRALSLQRDEPELEAGR